MSIVLYVLTSVVGPLLITVICCYITANNKHLTSNIKPDHHLTEGIFFYTTHFSDQNFSIDQRDHSMLTKLHEI